MGSLGSSPAPARTARCVNRAWAGVVAWAAEKTTHYLFFLSHDRAGQLADKQLLALLIAGGETVMFSFRVRSGMERRGRWRTAGR